MAEENDSDAALLLEGIVLRLQADLRWLEACETNLDGSKGEEMKTSGGTFVACRSLRKDYGSGRRASARRRRGRSRSGHGARHWR